MSHAPIPACRAPHCPATPQIPITSCPLLPCPVFCVNDTTSSKLTLIPPQLSQLIPTPLSCEDPPYNIHNLLANPTPYNIHNLLANPTPYMLYTRPW